MPEKIAMTPSTRPLSGPSCSGLQVEWQSVEVGSGVIYSPQESSYSELSEIESGEIEIEELSVIGRGGADKDYPATVYRTPSGNALRVISVNDKTGQGGLEWLKANLILNTSLIASSKLDLFYRTMIEHFFKKGVITPTYLGFLASESLGSVYLMTDESEGRIVVEPNHERYCDTFGAYNFAKEAIAKVYGKGWVTLDPTASNFLLGDDDIVILDAIPGKSLFSTRAIT